jgi:hypothetical protein
MENKTHTPIQNKVIGIISRDFHEGTYYSFVIDCHTLGIKEYPHTEMFEEFRNRVLVQRNYEGVTTKPKHSKLMEEKIRNVWCSIILPLVVNGWDKVMEAVEEQGQYCGYEYISDYEDYRSELSFQLQERFQDIIPFQWGGSEEN